MATAAVARETVVAALRREIARIEGTLAERLELCAPANGEGGGVVLRRGGAPETAALLATGAPSLDAALGGGLPRAALTEIHGLETRDAGAAAGFALALAALVLRGAGVKAPLLWVAAGEAFSEGGVPYAPGILHRFGIPPEALLVADVRRLEDALWVAEEAAALTALAAVLLEVRGTAPRLGLTATRRLHRRTQRAGRPFYLLRQAGLPEPTAAPVRLVVSPAPAGERHTHSGPLEGSIGPPAFRIGIGRSRLAIPATVTLEWNRDECAFHERQPSDVAAPDHGAVVPAAGERARPARQAGTVLAFDGAA